MIKRFKEILEGDLSLFEKAVTLAPQDFEINPEKTQLRCIKKEAEEAQKEHVEKASNEIMTHMQVQNKRSIYAVSFFLFFYIYFVKNSSIVIRKDFLSRTMLLKVN